VLILSASAELYVARAALEAGAIGYLLEARHRQRAARRRARRRRRHALLLDDVFRAVRERRARASDARRRAAASPATPPHPSTLLTDRELEVLQMIAAATPTARSPRFSSCRSRRSRPTACTSWTSSTSTDVAGWPLRAAQGLISLI
jgi:hypothetical protein